MTALMCINRLNGRYRAYAPTMISSISLFAVCSIAATGTGNCSLQNIELLFMQAKQLAEVLGAHEIGYACLVLDVRDIDEHTRCRIKGGPLVTLTGFHPARELAMMCHC